MSFAFTQKENTVVATCVPISNGTQVTSFVNGTVEQFIVFGLTHIPEKVDLEIGGMQISRTKCFNIIEGETELEFFKVPTELPLYKLLFQELKVRLYFKTPEIATQVAQETRLSLVRGKSTVPQYSAQLSDVDVIAGKYPEDPCPESLEIIPHGLSYFNPSLKLIFKNGIVVPSHVMTFIE
jgi:hypothetical protein